MSERVGKYEVLAPLTDGGMAQLFLGATAGPGGFRKYVVIKRMMPDSADDNLERMFLDEARITAAFSYSGIAQVFELGEDARGLYVVMEFIAGQNLNQVVHACAKQRAVLPLAFSVSVVNECALALHYAHTFKTQAGVAQTVIHRDVAQKNVMVTYDGQVKLLDFGIAKVKNALSKTKVGTVKGTAGYMSPEQVRGESLDARSDVFSLGVVLWEMVTGRRLFSAETELDELRMILEARIEPPSEIERLVPDALSDIVMKALVRDRSQRFASARELSRALTTRCPDLIFDAEARADFMHQRFADKIVSTQALFEAASSTMEELEVAIVAYRSDSEVVEDGPTSRARKQISASRLEPARSKPPPSKPSSPRAPQPRAASRPKPSAPRKASASQEDAPEPLAPDDEEAIDAALAKDREAAEQLRKKPSWIAPIVAVLVVFGIGFLLYKLVLEPREDSDAFVQSDRGLAPIPGLEGPPPPEPLKDPTPPAPPEVKIDPPRPPVKDPPRVVSTPIKATG